MKKVMYGLCALMLCFFVAACGNKKEEAKAAESMESLIKELKDAKDWDADKIKEFFTKFTDAQIEFLKAEPTEENYKEFQRLSDELEKAMDGLDEEAQQKFGLAILGMMGDEGFEKKIKEMEELSTKWEEKFGSKEADDDIFPAEEELDTIPELEAEGYDESGIDENDDLSDLDL